MCVYIYIYVCVCGVYIYIYIHIYTYGIYILYIYIYIYLPPSLLPPTLPTYIWGVYIYTYTYIALAPWHLNRQGGGGREQERSWRQMVKGLERVQIVLCEQLLRVCVCVCVYIYIYMVYGIYIHIPLSLPPSLYIWCISIYFYCARTLELRSPGRRWQ